MNLLPKQAGNRYPTSRYSVFSVKSVSGQICGQKFFSRNAQRRKSEETRGNARKTEISRTFSVCLVRRSHAPKLRALPTAPHPGCLHSIAKKKAIVKWLPSFCGRNRNLFRSDRRKKASSFFSPADETSAPKKSGCPPCMGFRSGGALPLPDREKSHCKRKMRPWLSM